jgi:hypothetical protein
VESGFSMLPISWSLPAWSRILLNFLAKGKNMARTFSIALMLFIGVVAFSTRTVAQSGDPAKSSGTHAGPQLKKVTISGTVGTEGKTLVGNRDNRIWNVANPESLRASEGRRVTVKALLVRNTNQINVSTVRLNSERLTAKLDDSAFRR